MSVAVAVRMTMLRAGHCVHPEFVVMRGGAFSPIEFPALVALIEHPSHGPMLFDTGYSPRIFAVAREFPLNIYLKVTPPTIREQATVAARLAARGVSPSEIRFVFLSHFHADHVAGVRDFPRARLVYLRHAFDAVKRTRGFAALHAGFLPALLPDDFAARSLALVPGTLAGRRIGIEIAGDGGVPFGIDVFGDGSIFAVELPGHAHGQMGLLLRTESGMVFLVADACWASRAYRERVFPNPVTDLIFSNGRHYRRTLTRLHRLHRRHPDWLIVPSHCREIAAKLGAVADSADGEFGTSTGAGNGAGHE